MTAERIEVVDSFRDAAPLLRRPFAPNAVKFKVQATWEGGALIVSYIDARLVVERLNLVCPHLWTDHYRPISESRMWCDLTVDAITRSDVGDGTGKGLVSDALKRAAVKFGVGVSLYAIPKIRLRESDGHIKPNRKEKHELTTSGENRARELYEAWLKGHGISAFGEPLDHGDADDAQGDIDAASEPSVATPQSSGNGQATIAPEDKPLTAAGRDKIAKAIEDAGIDEALLLAACGYHTLDDVRTVGAALKVRAELDKLTGAKA